MSLFIAARDVAIVDTIYNPFSRHWIIGVLLLCWFDAFMHPILKEAVSGRSGILAIGCTQFKSRSSCPICCRTRYWVEDLLQWSWFSMGQDFAAREVETEVFHPIENYDQWWVGGTIIENWAQLLHFHRVFAWSKREASKFQRQLVIDVNSKAIDGNFKSIKLWKKEEIPIDFFSKFKWTLVFPVHQLAHGTLAWARSEISDLSWVEDV